MKKTFVNNAYGNGYGTVYETRHGTGAGAGGGYGSASEDGRGAHLRSRVGYGLPRGAGDTTGGGDG